MEFYTHISYCNSFLQPFADAADDKILPDLSKAWPNASHLSSANGCVQATRPPASSPLCSQQLVSLLLIPKAGRIQTGGAQLRGRVDGGD